MKRFYFFFRQRCVSVHLHKRWTPEAPPGRLRVSVLRQRPSTTPMPPPPLWVSSPFRSIASKGLFHVTPFVPTPTKPQLFSPLTLPHTRPSSLFYCCSFLQPSLLFLHLLFYSSYSFSARSSSSCVLILPRRSPPSPHSLPCLAWRSFPHSGSRRSKPWTVLEKKRKTE